MCFIQLASEGYTSLQWLLLSQSTGSRHMRSVVVVCRPQSIALVVMAHRHLPCIMWNPLRPGIKPNFPALTDGFLTTGSPGKPYFCYPLRNTCWVSFWNIVSFLSDLQLPNFSYFLLRKFSGHKVRNKHAQKNQCVHQKKKLKLQLKGKKLSHFSRMMKHKLSKMKFPFLLLICQFHGCPLRSQNVYTQQDLQYRCADGSTCNGQAVYFSRIQSLALLPVSLKSL